MNPAEEKKGLTVKTTRRSFVVAAGAFSALLAAPFPTQQLGAVPPEANPLSDAGSAPTPKPSPDGLARLARERYGKFLNEKQLTLLDEKIAAVEMNSKRLQSVKLSNGNEPTTDFRAVRP